MISTIISSIPLWVFPTFFGLFWLGHRATRTRRAPVVLIYALPMLGLLSLSRASDLPEADVALTALLIAYVAGIFAGYRAQSRWTIARDSRRVELRGEWVTMITIMGVFGANFTSGMIGGLAPDLAAGAPFAVAFGLITGSLSGSLLGRALSVARTTPTAVDAAAASASAPAPAPADTAAKVTNPATSPGRA